MKVAKTIDEMRQLRQHLAEPVGFVPTMGYLHEGHLSLVRQARAENPSVVVSIFVNPTQFGPREDFKSYPRDIKRDHAMIEPLTDVVFMPPVAEMYPADFNSWIEVGQVTERLEGAFRPTHFRGVTTVVAKLFNIVQPNRAYFGQKDAQQAIVLKKMAADLNMNLEIITLPTVREADGLAMSSRNTYLNSKQRQAATVLFKTLSLAQELWSKGERDASTIRHEMVELVEKEPLASIDYISIADTATLKEMQRVKSPALVSLAVKIGHTRLIDNMVL
ncbi:pantoate--beta-alanine ligase [Chloroflexota bacterium]